MYPETDFVTMKSRYDFEQQVRALSTDLESAKEALRLLQSEQSNTLERINSTSTNILSTATKSLLEPIEIVCRIDEGLISFSKYPKLIRSITKKAWPSKTTESILEANSAKLKQGCHAAEQVFQDAERLLDDVAEEVIYEEERMTTMLGEKVWKVVNEFQDLRTELNERLAATKVALVDCENEKKQNEIEKKRLEVFLKEAGEKAAKLEAEKKKIKMGTASSTALAVTGAILTPFLPIAGVPMLCVGSGLALGSEIQASDCTNRLHEAQWSKDHYHSRIDDLRAKANRLRYTTLVQLERDERLFGILNTDLDKLKTTAGDLQSQANRQVRQVTEAKRAVSAAAAKIGGLNAHLGELELGYPRMREELVEVLDAVAGNMLMEGTEGTQGSQKDVRLVEEKVKQMRKCAPVVLTLLKQQGSRTK